MEKESYLTPSSGIIKKIQDTIKKYSMLSEGDRVLVGLSGGPDSVCLLSILHKLRDAFKIDLHALYIDHGLRPNEIKAEIEFCKNLCERLGIPLSIKSIDVRSYAKEHGLNRQEAARELRYMAFDEAAFEIKANRIAIAHNADDQAETLLMRLFRGSGTKGLSGIPPVRRNIIRPLIETERKEIEKFLDEETTDFVIDSSNLKEDYFRNKIRLSLIPILKGFNPDIVRTLSKTADILREEERYLETIVTKALIRLISRKTSERIELFLTPMEVMDRIILRRVIRRAIDETKGLRGIGFLHVEDILHLIKNGNPGDRLYLPKGIRAIKGYSTLIITPEAPVKLKHYTLEVPGELVIKEAGIMINASVEAFTGAIRESLLKADGKTSAFFDLDKLTLPLKVRPRKAGDLFYPFGFGKRKKLQDYLVDEKVPRDERDTVALIVSGDDIVWVVGYRTDDRFKVTAATKRILALRTKRVNT